MKCGYACCLGLLLASCSHPYEPVSKGVTGYLSDRAWEIDAELQGTLVDPQTGPGVSRTVAVNLEVARVAAALEIEGKPLFLERARVDSQASTTSTSPGSLTWTAHVQSLATKTEVPEGPGIYTSDKRVRFRSAPEEAKLSKPDYSSLAADRTLRVAVLFGQIEGDAVSATDVGYWARESFARDLLNQGYQALFAPQQGWQSYARYQDQLQVQIDLAGPDTLALETNPDVLRETLRSVLASHEITYLNGHANQEALEVLGESSCFAPAGYRIVVLDVCWSTFLYARPVILAAPWGNTHVVSVNGRVVTGSVESFSGLLSSLVGSTALASAGTSEGTATWYSLLVEMNARAEARSKARKGLVSEALEPPEIYGVSGVWKPWEEVPQ